MALSVSKSKYFTKVIIEQNNDETYRVEKTDANFVISSKNSLFQILLHSLHHCSKVRSKVRLNKKRHDWIHLTM